METSQKRRGFHYFSPFHRSFHLYVLFLNQSKTCSQCKEQLMTVIIYLRSRQINIIKRIEIRLIGIILVSQVCINNITTIAQTKSQRALSLGIIEVCAGAI